MCSGRVGQDPVLPVGRPGTQFHSFLLRIEILSPGVDPRVAVIGAPVPPADHACDHIAAVLLDNQGAAGVSLARVLARVSGADVHAERERDEMRS